MNIPWYGYAFASSIFATAFVLFRKKALIKEHALDFEAARSLSMVLLLLFLLPFIKITVSLKIIVFLYFATILGSVGIVFMSKAYKHSQISKIYPLGNLRPFFVLVLAYIFLGERVSPKNVIGVGVLFLGAYVLEADHHFVDLWYPIKYLFESKYNLYLILSLLIFSITALIDKYLITNYFDPITFLFLAWTFIAFNLNVYHGLKFGFIELKNCFKKTHYLPLAVAAFSIGANFFYLSALKLAYVSLVMPVLMLSTLFVVLIGGEFFKESNVGYRVVVSFVMLVGVYLIIT